MADNPEKSSANDASDRRSRTTQSADLEKRLDSLNERLGRKSQAKAAEQQARSKGDTAGIGQAMRLSSEFIAAILVGAGFGYAIDTFFGTSPWGMIVLLMLGFCAAILNVLRASGAVAESGMRLHKVREQTDKNSDPSMKSGSDDMYDDD